MKFVFKIKILTKLLKQSNESIIFPEQKIHKSSFINNKTEKNSFRNINSNSKNSYSISDFEGISGYEYEISKLNSEEKESYLQFIQNIDYQTITNSFIIIQNKQFFNKIKSKLCLDILRTYYNENIVNNHEINNETYMITAFNEILSINEYEFYELYDLFKFNDRFSITELGFVIIVYFFSAFESGQLEECFMIFSDDLFLIINAEEQVMSLNRMKDFGRVLGLNESLLMKVAQELKLDMYSVIDLEKFKLFYLMVMRKYDESFKSQLLNSSVKKGGKVSTNSTNKFFVDIK